MGAPLQQLLLARLRQRLHELPVLPNMVVKTVGLQAEGDAYTDEIVNLVGSDPGFTARLLAYANSAAVGAGPPVSRLRDAVMRVGPREAAHIVVAGSASAMFSAKTDRERMLWWHALSTAAIARRVTSLVPRYKADPDEAYVAGLLHDVGRFVLFLEAPDAPSSVDETAWEMPAELLDAELELCGLTHAELGFLAAQKWGLPADLAAFIRYHHATLLPGVEPHIVSLVEIVRVADWISIALLDTDWRALDRAAMRDRLSSPVSKAGAGPWSDRWHDEICAAMTEAEDRASLLGF